MTCRIVIVTGTGTGVGKTIASAALAVRASEVGSVIVVKPVQTGMGAEHQDTADVEVVRSLTGCDVLELTTLSDPLAPDSAARLRGVQIPPIADYVHQIRLLAERYDRVIVEGAGGLLVRLDTVGGTLLDVADLLGADVVVVVSAELGTLNHTELTVGALRSRGIEPTGLIIGSWPPAPSLAETRNRADLPRVSGVPLVAAIPVGAAALSTHEFGRLASTWWE